MRLREYAGSHKPSLNTYGSRRDKTCLRGFRKSEIQTSLLSYRDKLEYQNFACSMFRDVIFQNANNKGVDQSARMRRLVCAYVVHKPPNTGFLASRPICEKYQNPTNLPILLLFIYLCF